MEVSCACPVARRLKTCGPVLNSPFGTCHDEITRTAVAMINGRAIHLPQLCQNLYFLGCILIYPPEFTRPTWTNLPQTISFLLAKSTNIRRSRPLPILIRTWSILGPAVMQFRATPGDQVFPPWVPGPESWPDRYTEFAPRLRQHVVRRSRCRRPHREFAHGIC